MNSVDADSALKRLDQIAQAEYGADFAKAIETPDEAITVRRMARLTGIELQHPFAQPRPYRDVPKPARASSGCCFGAIRCLHLWPVAAFAIPTGITTEELCESGPEISG
jgi:hypothetical protein